MSDVEAVKQTILHKSDAPVYFSIVAMIHLLFWKNKTHITVSEEQDE